VSPNNPTVLNNLGMTYVLEGNLSEASQLFRRAAASREARPTVARNVAMVEALKNSTGAKKPAKPARADAAAVPTLERPYGLGRGVSTAEQLAGK
jgi:Flp pilus assembly protein TadD